MWPELDMISVESADARQSTASGLETVTLTGIDQTANVDSPSHRRLVCRTADGGLLVISDPDERSGNVRAIEAAAEQCGWPLTIRCRTRAAGHAMGPDEPPVRLVRQDPPLEIVTPPGA
jgi:hypothetical protein